MPAKVTLLCNGKAFSLASCSMRFSRVLSARYDRQQDIAAKQNETWMSIDVSDVPGISAPVLACAIDALSPRTMMLSREKRLASLQAHTATTLLETMCCLLRLEVVSGIVQDMHAVLEQRIGRGQMHLADIPPRLMCTILSVASGELQDAEKHLLRSIDDAAKRGLIASKKETLTRLKFWGLDEDELQLELLELNDDDAARGRKTTMSPSERTRRFSSARTRALSLAKRTKLAKRQQLLEELVETEASYVNQLARLVGHFGCAIKYLAKQKMVWTKPTISKSKPKRRSLLRKKTQREETDKKKQEADAEPEGKSALLSEFTLPLSSPPPYSDDNGKKKKAPRRPSKLSAGAGGERRQAPLTAKKFTVIICRAN